MSLKSLDYNIELFHTLDSKCEGFLAITNSMSCTTFLFASWVQHKHAYEIAELLFEPIRTQIINDYLQTGELMIGIYVFRNGSWNKL